MHCPSCGAALPEEARFCQVCGAVISGEQQAPPQPLYQPGPVQPAEPLGLPITALVLGILALLSFSLGVGALFGLVALILGFVAMKRAPHLPGRPRTGWGLGLAGAITGGCGFLAGLVSLIIFGAVWFAQGEHGVSTGSGPFGDLLGSREKARQTACLSNEKQLCLGLIMYVQDYDESYPPATQWADNIQPYVKNNQILVCPSKPELNCGYAFNSKLGGSYMAKLTQPAFTVMLFESDQGMNAAGGPELLAAPRHQDGLNFGYADGHCKWLSSESYGTLQWELSDAPKVIN